MSLYLIISWNTNEILQEHESLSKAKRECRKLGFEMIGDQKAPIAYVSDGDEYEPRRYGCVYNPRFK